LAFCWLCWNFDFSLASSCSRLRLARASFKKCLAFAAGSLPSMRARRWEWSPPFVARIQRLHAIRPSRVVCPSLFAMPSKIGLAQSGSEPRSRLHFSNRYLRHCSDCERHGSGSSSIVGRPRHFCSASIFMLAFYSTQRADWPATVTGHVGFARLSGMWITSECAATRAEFRPGRRGTTSIVSIQARSVLCPWLYFSSNAKWRHTMTSTIGRTWASIARSPVQLFADREPLRLLESGSHGSHPVRFH
jgi:hypothetical protein